ncbi:MAG: hypothetical protein AAGA33_08500 [Pseudomonadota bacterium]
MKILSQSLMLAVALLLTTPTFSDDTAAAAQAPAIGGFSPVSYFTENKAERGSEEFAVEHNGRLYYLTSEAQVELFKLEPEKYRPRHPSCPYSLAHGMVLPLDPTNFKVIGDSLLLFHRSEEKDALLEWNNSELSEEELLRRADANLWRVEF